MAGKHRRPKSETNDRKTTIYLDEDFKVKLRELAEKDGRSLSSFIEWALRESLEEPRQQL